MRATINILSAVIVAQTVLLFVTIGLSLVLAAVVRVQDRAMYERLIPKWFRADA